MTIQTETAIMVIIGLILILVSTVIDSFISWALFFSGLSIIALGLIIDVIVQKWQ